MMNPDIFLSLSRHFGDHLVIMERGAYRIKIAEDAAEILSAQRLRYRVFCDQLGCGKKSSVAVGADTDGFDAKSLHLIVQHKYKSEPVGTYRIISGQNDTKSMYSAREFQISGFDSLLPQMLEVGRSCVDPEFRNGSVVGLLWKGITEILNITGRRYLAGCVSLTDRRPETAWILYEYFKTNHMISDKFLCFPHSPFTLPDSPPQNIAKLLENTGDISKLIPPLFKGYLHLGGKICSTPAYDFEFGTIDFLILTDAARIPEKYKRHFNCTVSADKKILL